MPRKYILILLSILIFSCHPAHGSEPVFSYLDEFYKPLTPKGSFLLDEEFYYLYRDYSGVHENTAYDKVDGHGYFYSLDNRLKFSPLSNLEIEAGLNESFPSRNKIITHDTAGGDNIREATKLVYYRDYTFKTRLRLDRAEFYMDYFERMQKSRRTQSQYDQAPYYFVNVHSSYRDIKAGARYISGPTDVLNETNLSKITRPLLNRNQISVVSELGYRQAELKRTQESDNDSWYFGHLDQVLNAHYIPKIILNYGLFNDLEIEAGLDYATPYKYKCEYELNYRNGTTYVFAGNFKVNNDLSVPLKLRWRPMDSTEIGFSSDLNYANQRITYWQRATSGVTTNYPVKKLTYLNTQPTLTLSYLDDKDKQINKDEFSALTKTLLRKDQYLLNLEAKKDITHLIKGSAGGGQNILDPYGIFMYPYECFVTGTEYAVIYTGNTTAYATNISPQNFYQVKGSFTYGINDSFNPGITVGYHSGSALHNFTFFDFSNRFSTFKPYYFIDPFFDLRPTKNSLLSFRGHYVPRYRQIVDRNAASSSITKDLTSDVDYFEASINLKILF